jgi:hypothetical protein
MRLVLGLVVTGCGRPPLRPGTADSGSPISDSGSPATDTGTPTVDSGTPTVDSGTPAADSGSPAVDSGTPVPDGGVNCANIGCGLPPLCSEGCRAPCGCCPCAPGERNGTLICTDRGCYEPAPPSDAGADAGWKPPAICALPFDVGPCDAAWRVFAYVDGACVMRGYGGCGGNENRFWTLEECLATCEGRPEPNVCPLGRIPARICIACGPVGGCGKQIDACALACDRAASICTGGLFCWDGVCQVAGCD